MNYPFKDPFGNLRIPSVLAAIAAAGLLVAAYFVLIRDDKKDFLASTKYVRIETAGEVCWTATLPVPPERPEQPPEQQGCGSTVLTLGGEGGVAVTKTSEEGTLTVVALTGTRETARQSTNDLYGTVYVSP